MEVQRVCYRTHTNREAASTASRPEIAQAPPKKHQKHYKPNAFLMILNFFYSMAQVKLTLLYTEIGKHYKTHGFLDLLHP